MDERPRLLLQDEPACPFCQMEQLTRWYFHDPVTGLVICEDTNAHKNGLKYRLLCVFTGHGRHTSQEWSAANDEWVKEKALKIAERLREEIGWTESSWDYEMSFPYHYHIQLELN